ncbi:MAG: bifunctional (p)ppGpp synthetase/guanosine-3',5'-bis(diphosphate) 3'-pyrophosphohydrolase [Oscillospiraceae bacterium]|nr:bifunctional (p)ppGpp synthetase/guanosine-3',5'-bis(diphosphate) 3'-pyrophosphohydrolase [Oscillospiraceae bacterium]
MDPILERYQALEEKVLAYNPNLDTKLLYSAFQYADQQHSKQMRRDGTPYITHPLAVADIIADLKLDTESLLAALLHDCIEDTSSTHEDIARLFGEPVADLVEGVTKLSQIKYNSVIEKQSENLRKMLMAMSKDIRVVLVKLCDRLHNMRTMQYQTPKKQREKSLETMEIYAPIAHRLGMSQLKYELEDHSIHYLDPMGCKEIEDTLSSRFSRHQEFLANTQERIQERMKQEGIRCTITSRSKHVYSIYRKMFTQHKTLDEIFDLYALRIIVDNVPECYNALGQVHDMFNLVPGRFKDYISTPKPNMYQSLHTTVIGREGIPFEVQIRTWEMHETAEYGIAAHWKYKQGGQGAGSEQTYEWVRRLLESQQDTEAEEFVKSLKVDLFSDEVFVFTPNGEIKGLPAGSTPIDFAYSIHSAVGNHMIGAKINNRIVPFHTQLQNGDIVEIQTSKAAKGPSRDWLKLAKSNEARNKIRQWFKKERRTENILNGRSAFEAELKRNGLTMEEISTEENLPRILKKVQYNSLDDLYAAIGYGGMTSMKAVNRVKGEMNAIIKEQKEAAAVSDLLVEEQRDEVQDLHVKTNLPADEPKEKKRTVSKSGVIVEGVENCLVKFAKCCAPVPGDPIIGFVTKGFGVSVHRTDCANASPKARKTTAPGRWIGVQWAQQREQKEFRTTLEVYAKDRPNLFLDVAAALSAARVRTDGINARGLPDGYATVSVILCVKDRYDLETVVRKISSVGGVMSVTRGKG